YLLHPGLMDSAIQSSIGLVLNSGALSDGSKAPLKPSIPFALESLKILGSCTSEMYAWVRNSGGSTPSDKVQKLDIGLCDEQGNVCVQMRGLSLQEMEITSQRFEKISQDQKTVELSLLATDFGISSSIHKLKTVELTSLSCLEAIPNDSSFENKRFPVGISLQPSHSHATTLSSAEALQPDHSPQTLISKETLEEGLKVSLAKALYMKVVDVDVEKPFIDMGLDSIVGVEWIKAINQEYGTSVSATKVYDYPTIQKFALFLEEEINKISTSTSKKASSPSKPVTLLKAKGSVPLVSSLHRQIKTRRKPNPVVVNGRGISHDKVAIVGMSGRYPDAYNLNQYWDNLVQGKNSIREIPQSRWDVSKYYDPDPANKGKVYCKWLGMLDDIDCFDPMFFQISPAEAEVMDPQHRLFLQEGYKAFEDAGYSNDALSNKKCGVYLGIMSSEYSLLLSQGRLVSTDTTGSSYAIAAARIAYYLNLKGPAIPVDTACSSSLVAIHLACQALLNYEIDMALTGGVSLYLTPGSYLGMCQAGMLSPEGQCKTFDDSADGFVPGEGVGTVVLKRLKDAERDNDSIYGVILGSGINQDGKTNGITAPSVNSQIELERDIYSRYKINPESISYVETHGTGTRLGDPIELEALSTVFREKASKKNYCALASVKSNIGHTSGAAGVASVQKVLLSMKHKKLVPSLNCTKENKHFDFKNSPFYVNKETKVWETDVNSLRRACVSSFGFSGTNAHLVLEEYPSSGKSRESISVVSRNSIFAIPLSAKNKDCLYGIVKELQAFLSENRQISLNSLAYTLQVGRGAMEERLGFIVTSIKELEVKLKSYLSGNQEIDDLYQGQVKRNKDTLAVFTANEELQEAVEKWIQRRKYASIIDLWVKGLSFDWNKLYGETKPKCISLPTYPFARERYWISETQGKGIIPTSGTHVSVIHPLLHENTSDLSEQRFTSTFTGKEFFLNDHQVKGEKVLPGVGYLEMARAAVEKASGEIEEGTTIHLKHVVWAQPIIVDCPARKVHVGLYGEDSGQIQYEVYTDSDNEEGAIVHSRGVAEIKEKEETPALDIQNLRSQMNARLLSAEDCYQAFKKM
ncbi:MAG: polyketide synthase, partial [Planctomycetes bacterium]|nr:polyketide synthase [Planctomycetota bacterium]